MKMQVHNKVFATKGECEAFFCKMLNRYRSGDLVSQQDADCLLSLLEYHPDVEEKIGCGVKQFMVMQEPFYKKYNHFLIVRNDNSTVDFSYKKCISTAKTTHLQEVIKACRYDVVDQIAKFRSMAFGTKKYVRCGITGLNVQSKDAHIDHKPPKTFNQLVFLFLKDNNLTLDQVAIDKLDDVGDIANRTLRDESLRKRWQQYHQQHADLRVTLDHANLGQAKVKVLFDNLN